MKTTLIAACATLALAGTAAAEPSWRDFKGVANTSYVEPSGDKALQLSIVVPATPHEVFAAFTTSEGFASWAAPVAKVDLRIGGTIESNYDPKARIGDPGNIKNQIVAYVPDRLLVIRNIQAPPEFADPDLFGRTVTMIELQPEGPKATKVVLTNAGYGPGPKFATIYGHFEWGDAYTLAELKKRFEAGPTDWKRSAEAARSRAADRQMQSKPLR